MLSYHHVIWGRARRECSTYSHAPMPPHRLSMATRLARHLLRLLLLRLSRLVFEHLWLASVLGIYTGKERGNRVKHGAFCVAWLDGFEGCSGGWANESANVIMASLLVNKRGLAWQTQPVAPLCYLRLKTGLCPGLSAPTQPLLTPF